MNFNDLKKPIPNLREPMEFGFEKEFLLQATSKKSGQLYNLNIAEELLAFIPKGSVPAQHTIVPEYSKCLVEVVSEPYEAVDVFDGLEKINSVRFFLEEQLARLIQETYPKLWAGYEIILSDEGSSPSNQYLYPDLTTQSDQGYATELVLPKYMSLVAEYEKVEWRIGGIVESMIGIYNHINSFHMTFHPTYANDYSYANYASLLSATQSLVAKYELHDVGNRELYRNGNVLQLQHNVRNLFLQKFLELRTPGIGPNFAIPRNAPEHEAYVGSLSKKLMATSKAQHLDQAFKSWSSLNMRPRIIADLIPAIEIRQFGSCFSRSEEARKLIKDILALDSVTVTA